MTAVRCWLGLHDRVVRGDDLAAARWECDRDGCDWSAEYLAPPPGL